MAQEGGFDLTGLESQETTPETDWKVPEIARSLDGTLSPGGLASSRWASTCPPVASGIMPTFWAAEEPVHTYSERAERNSNVPVCKLRRPLLHLYI